MPVLEIPVAARQLSMRSVGVRRVATVNDALDAITAVVDAGGCVAYIRNVVADAVTAWRELQARGYDPMLFHARMAMCDRQLVERRVLETFGKNGTPAMRAGKIVVSTQVIEQSLDCDFDLVVTDLCPIDLAIQRAGRLWRHDRDWRPTPSPEMLVVSPEPECDAGPRWYASMFRSASFVYPGTALLWLTAKELFTRGVISTPDGVRPMVEAVYGADAQSRVPVGLRDDFAAAEGKAFGDTAKADNNLLVPSAGYQPGHQGWAQDVLTPTRLGEPTRALRLARWNGVTLTPYAGGSGFRDWLLSEVSIARRKAVRRDEYEDSVLEGAARELEKEWSDDSFIFVVGADGVGELGVWTARRAETRRYSPGTGLS